MLHLIKLLQLIVIGFFHLQLKGTLHHLSLPASSLRRRINGRLLFPSLPEEVLNYCQWEIVTGCVGRGPTDMYTYNSGSPTEIHMYVNSQLPAFKFQSSFSGILLILKKPFELRKKPSDLWKYIGDYGR